MKTIYLIRHGETKANSDCLFRGRIDYGLNAKGMEESIHLRTYISSLKPGIVYSSPLKRAMQTAELATNGKYEIVSDKRLNNLDLGNWAGSPISEIIDKYPVEWLKWHVSPREMAFPGGEKMTDMFSRVSEFISFVKTIETDHILVVSHRSVIKALLGIALDISGDFFGDSGLNIRL